MRPLSAPTITIRYFAGAAAAAGRDEERVHAPSEPTLDAVLADIAAARPDVADVLVRCSFLWDGVAVRDHAAPLAGAGATGGHTLDVLPPFAGG